MSPKKRPLKVIAGTPDQPLIIGDIEIPCYVLEDETRVLSQRGLFSGINLRRGGIKKETEAKSLGAQMPRFAYQNWLRPFITNDLEVSLKSPILFNISPAIKAYGYPATVLVDICEAILEAHKRGATTARQSAVIERARILTSGFTRIGIIGLVDEATGYQKLREARALATILEKFIAKELQPWIKTFPYEYYEQIFRLKKWKGPKGVNRPKVIGHYTNNYVYDRLAPGVLQELKKTNPITEKGYRASKHHQLLTPEYGNPKLREHIAAVIALMKVADNFEEFKTLIDKVFPKIDKKK